MEMNQHLHDKLGFRDMIVTMILLAVLAVGSVLIDVHVF
jgi:hypothetical protein